MIGPSRWQLPDPWGASAGEELLGVGADLAPTTLVAAYRAGLFPMPTGRPGALRLRKKSEAVGWWSPDPRGILPLAGLQVSRSLRASCRRLHVTFDTAFDEVVLGCGDPSRPHGWINAEIRAAYGELHRLGVAHSVETRDETGTLVGGLYGVEVGGMFAGESMFHRTTDASKVAVVALVDRLKAASEPDQRLFDVQWRTDNLARLGVIEVPRERYLELLAVALELSPAFSSTR